MQENIKNLIIDVKDHCSKMKTALDALNAIQTAVAEAGFCGKECGNALYCIYTVLEGYNEELSCYAELLTEGIKWEGSQ